MHPPSTHRPALTPRFRNGVELFEHATGQRPDSPGLLYFDTAVTFREASETAHALARAMREDLGVGAGERIALMMQNVPQMAISFEAVWLLGAIATPVNVMYKQRELVHQLTDAGARVIVCLESLYELVAEAAEHTAIDHIVTVSELDYLEQVPHLLSGHTRADCPTAHQFAALIARHRGQPFTPGDPDPASPALICYTSGTTGAAKGALITHQAVAYNAELWQRWYELTPDEVVVAMAPLFHITGLMGHLAAARAAMAPLLLGYRFEPGELMGLIERWRGTFAVGPLTAYIALLEHPSAGSRDLSSLTKLASGGAPVAQGVIDRFERAVGVYIHNAYGLTETTSAVLLVPFGERAPVDEDGNLSVGVPVDGVEARVVGLADGLDVQPGEIGELLLKGPMVATQYWQRPEATAETFVAGWFHTGDVAKRDEHGWYWIVDRVKDVIIASGYKVWPREVEDVLYLHPAVAEASVIGVPDSYRGESVRAYLVLKRGSVATPPEIIEHCRRLLAVYKAPREVQIVDEIPKTATGKILKRELRTRVAAELDHSKGDHA